LYIRLRYSEFWIRFFRTYICAVGFWSALNSINCWWSLCSNFDQYTKKTDKLLINVTLMYVRLTGIVVINNLCLTFLSVWLKSFFLSKKSAGDLLYFHLCIISLLSYLLHHFKYGGVFEKIRTQNVLLKYFYILLEIFLTLRRTDDILW